MTTDMFKYMSESQRHAVANEVDEQTRDMLVKRYGKKTIEKYLDD